LSKEDNRFVLVKSSIASSTSSFITSSSSSIPT
jgi:hypothetical protein